MTTTRRRVAFGLAAAAGVAVAAAVLPLVTGTRSVALGPWTLPVREAWRPLALAAVVLALRALLVRPSRAPEAPRQAAGWPETSAVVVFACGLSAAIFFWAHLHVRFCGGLDSYGYVSAARALASGDLVHREPMVEWLPFARAIDAATPLGWIAAPSGSAIVPAYPLGFPAVMAAAILALGPGAAFYVPLLAGAGIVALSYRLTREVAGPIAGAAAAMVVAWNPVLINMAVQPMSDAPAAFWYLLALTLLVVPPGRPAAAGLAFAMAIWTRPLVLALAPALLLLLPRRREAFLRFAAGMAPVGLAMAGLQWMLYGSPLRTGYGGTAGLFTTRNIGRHLAAFTTWTVAVHGPASVIAFAAGIWRAPRRLVLAAVTGLLLGVVPYLFNLQYFDDWDLVRYVLPGLIPCVIVGTIGVLAIVQAHARRTTLILVAAGLAAVAAVGSARYVAGQSTWQLARQESRYEAVGAWVRQHTREGSLVLADLQSGSLRLYADRPTLRWVRMPPGSLAPTLEAARRRGIDCYAALDGDDEARSFERQFAAEMTGIAAEPEGRIRSVMIYKLSARPAVTGGAGRPE